MILPRRILLPAVIVSGASLLIKSISSVASLSIQYPVYEGQPFANDTSLLRAGAPTGSGRGANGNATEAGKQDTQEHFKKPTRAKKISLLTEKNAASSSTAYRSKNRKAVEAKSIHSLNRSKILTEDENQIIQSTANSAPLLSQVFRSTERHEGRKDGMAACMIFMDDNHYLIEWLAYHYYRLPLKRLIIAVDPKSKTSPAEILNRYHSRGLINVTTWGDEDFLSRELVEKYKDKQVRLYMKRQSHFIYKCLDTLKEENRTWVAVIDTDEFILPNSFADEETRIDISNRTVNDILDARSARTEKWKKIDEIPCHTMTRLLMGVKEPPQHNILQDRVPQGFNGSDFMTMRYVFPGNKSIAGKVMIDLSRIPHQDIKQSETNSHRPLKNYCVRSPPPEDSPFLVYQYAGTFDQFNYRIDGRGTRTLERYEGLRYEHDRFDISVTDWLQGFVDQLGENLTKALLSGIGQVEPWLNVTESID